MTDDVKIPISTPGAKEAKQALDGVKDSLRDLGDKGRKGGEDAAKGTAAVGDAAQRSLSSVRSLIAGYVGLQGALKVIQAIRQAHQEAYEITLRHADALRAVMAQDQLMGMRPEQRQAIYGMAAASGRKVEEVSPAYAMLMGGTMGMTPERQQGLMQQALLMGKTDPAANLADLVSLVSTMGTQNPDLTPEQIGNLSWHTFQSAKTTAGEMAAYLPAVLSAARSGKVGPEEATALFSFATRAGGGVAKSGTAVSATMLGLLAPGKETAKRLGEFGFPFNASLMDKVTWLAQNGERLPDDLAAALGGRRGIEAVVAIRENPSGFQAEVSASRASLSRQGSGIGESLASMYGEEPAQRAADQIKQLTVLNENARVDDGTLSDKARIAFREAYSRRKGNRSDFSIRTNRFLDQGAVDLGIGLGGTMDPYENAMEQLVAEGYQPSDVLGLIPYTESLSSSERRQFWMDPAAGPQILRKRLQSQGVRPMQVYNGGTHYHSDNRNDPAGKPQPASVGR